jgi:RNA recognition motif-containing protein
MAAPCENLSISGLPAGTNEASVKTIFGAYGDITSVKVFGRSAFVKFATVDEAKWIQENLNGNMPEGLTEPIEVKFSPEKGKGKDAGKGGKDSWSNGGKGDLSSGKGGKGDKGDSWGPYAKGGKDNGKGEGKGKDGKDGKGKGKGKIGIRDLFHGLCEAGALPGGAKYENDENTLYVKGLPSDTTDLDLYRIFSPFGSIAPQGIKAMLWRDSGLCKGFGFVNFMDPAASTAAVAALNGTTMGDEGATLEVMNKRLDDGAGESAGDGKGGGKGDGKDYGKGKWGKGKGKWK